VAWLAARSTTSQRADAADAPATTPIEIVTVAPPAPPPAEPLAVQLFAPPAAEPAAGPPPPTPPPPRPLDPARARAGAPPRRTPLLAMRRGEVPRVVLPAGRWDDLDHAPRGAGPERPASTGILQPDGGGRYRSDQGGFDAEVRPDGAVALTDQSSFQ